MDEDIGEKGAYYRIRSDRFSWRGKKSGGWLATCDEMPSGDLSEDPAEDKVRSEEGKDEYDPEVYIINSTQHIMIAAADQSPGVIMVNANDDDEESVSDDED